MKDPELLYLVGGVVAVLLIATLITRILIGRSGETAVLVNLRQRVNAWWWMMIVFCSSLALGKSGVFWFYGLLSFLALREFITLSPTPRGDHRTLTWVFFLILPLHYIFAGAPWYGMFLIWIPVYAFVFIPIRSALAGDTERFLERTARIQWGVLTCIYFLSYLPMLLYLPIEGYHGQNAKLLFFVVLVTQISDVMQYVFGKLFGKTKIAPKVSPSKTREGLLYGGAAATLIGTSLWWATPFTPVEAAIMSIVLVASGFFGGLVMSAVKRSLGAKDWGRGIPGHGGVLDRLDSLLFAGPIFFHIVGYYFDTSMHDSYQQPQWMYDALRLWIGS
ncbi:phosphatidate cytidylyltransferase [Luteolibacter flavescens]|uniref:Phosphatidate cytidylyltransferase n=1 Tax=Luteolibacter flavescens TaxID=1859460 RepID=A0ABT3FQA5_9BACT|nr:phosphatidate cytidylyltransferase [Luteolibacter flavescens]MCW1885759.1 phosphatidate cytidylyltransferase [Luteolibacter flavescens]